MDKGCAFLWSGKCKGRVWKARGPTGMVAEIMPKGGALRLFTNIRELISEINIEAPTIAATLKLAFVGPQEAGHERLDILVSLQ